MGQNIPWPFLHIFGVKTSNTQDLPAVTSTSWLDFGDDPDRDADTGFF